MLKPALAGKPGGKLRHGRSIKMPKINLGFWFTN